MLKRVANNIANTLLGAAAIIPIYFTLHYLLFDRLKPNPNYPKMQDDLGLVCISFHTLLFLVFLRVVVARSLFVDRFGGVRGHNLWCGVAIGLFVGWLLVFMLGTGTDGFLD
ncbi:hypothetical protein CCAX7_17570 [Capsulimonas corticalis]|uniref:Uncharacterized protein n=1 Tax=Capsulimonas corticalis TaxID=2219043 RepID=A0A402D3X1_9BACT|nr:hypothetical protein [Capsulimonas corticalis]BDI29706.1 hypothetical protein CCAX7_17570 [Capsulimonas corticalis]